MAIKNAKHRKAIEAAQDMVVALVMHAYSDLDDREADTNLRRSFKELDKAIKALSH